MQKGQKGAHFLLARWYATRDTARDRLSIEAKQGLKRKGEREERKERERERATEKDEAKLGGLALCTREPAICNAHNFARRAHGRCEVTAKFQFPIVGRGARAPRDNGDRNSICRSSFLAAYFACPW